MIEIYLSDLSKEKQKEIISELGDNGNYDIFPIATIEIENKEEEWMKFEKPKCFTFNSDTYPLCTGAKHPADFAENDCIRCKLYVNYT